jgi:glucoamylase
MSFRGLVILIAVFGASAWGSSAFAASPGSGMSTAQFHRSLEGVFANLLPHGAVLASPSTREPNYAFHWVRDSALTWKALLAVARSPNLPESSRRKILERAESWVRFETGIQNTPKLTDLGEPRFETDGRANFDPWGRPQNDGPALRALTLMDLARFWISEGRVSAVEQHLYQSRLPAGGLIKKDLEYVAHHWRDQSFDLWEEEKGLHYYTLTVQESALETGAQFALQMKDPGAADFYREQASSIARERARFLIPDSGLIAYALDRSSPLPHKTSPLDISVILAGIQTWNGAFRIPAPAAYETLRNLTRDAEVRYAINRVRTGSHGEPLGVALGRYPEDRYTGTGFGEANPWFLSTLASAEFLCRWAADPMARALRNTLLRAADAQFNRVHRHRLPDGGLPEQFDRNTGYVRGARDLTWSYASYLTAYLACLEAGNTPAP